MVWKEWVGIGRGRVGTRPVLRFGFWRKHEEMRREKLLL